MNLLFRLTPLLVVLAACKALPRGEEVASAEPDVTGVIDSLIPMDEALARFRADLTEPARLRSSIRSRDELVAMVVRALETQSPPALEQLAVNRAEWAFLYFPTNILARPPYELPPSLAWFQLQEGNRKGVTRALRELGGHELDYRGYACDPEPTVEGENRIWTGCAVTVGRDGGQPVTLRLFSAILERDGRFAMLSFDNDF